jgi:PAS domain-containing protein
MQPSPTHQHSKKTLGNLTMGKTQRNCCRHVASQEVCFRPIVEHAPNVLWSCDRNLNFTYFSPAIKVISGYTAEEKQIQGPSNYSPAAQRPVSKNWLDRSSPGQRQHKAGAGQSLNTNWNCNKKPSPPTPQELV